MLRKLNPIGWEPGTFHVDFKPLPGNSWVLERAFNLNQVPLKEKHFMKGKNLVSFPQNKRAITHILTKIFPFWNTALCFKQTCWNLIHLDNLRETETTNISGARENTWAECQLSPPKTVAQKTLQYGKHTGWQGTKESGFCDILLLLLSAKLNTASAAGSGDRYGRWQERWPHSPFTTWLVRQLVAADVMPLFTIFFSLIW